MAKSKSSKAAAPKLDPKLTLLLDSLSSFKTEVWPIDKPKPYPKNARIIPDKAIKTVANSLQQFGFRQPIVVDKEGVIVVGHTRLLAAKSLGLTQVLVSVADKLSPEKIRQYRIMDNKSNEETDWDVNLLRDEIEEIAEEAGGDLEVVEMTTGFGEKEFGALTEVPDPHADRGEATQAHHKGASKILHECPKCRHTWTGGDERPASVPAKGKKRNNPFGTVDD